VVSPTTSCTYKLAGERCFTAGLDVDGSSVVCGGGENRYIISYLDVHRSSRQVLIKTWSPIGNTMVVSPFTL
jgi:hypothetical protein